MNAATVQVNEHRTWINIPEGATLAGVDEVPVIRNGGPRDGERLGTAYRDGEGWAVRLL